jgi:hypothetical protein
MKRRERRKRRERFYGTKKSVFTKLFDLTITVTLLLYTGSFTVDVVAFPVYS